MGVYTHKIAQSEYSLFYRKSGKWTNYSKLYDGDLNSSPTNQADSIGLKMDMSWLPSGMRLCGVTVRLGYKRGGSNGASVWLRSTNSQGNASASYRYDLAEIQTAAGTYNVLEYHEGTAEISQGQSEAFLANENKYIVMNYSPEKTEIEVTFSYTENGDIPIYVGNSNISGLYVGDTEASAVYVGTTKVL